ncbi:hypothetical protein ACF1GS_31275 [Streptomyces eurythermus]|uniref:hypothetical protein n=1 Tax=Streptomyces eurythermus TaxID=42237 RepID=UPI0033E3FA71
MIRRSPIARADASAARPAAVRDAEPGAAWATVCFRPPHTGAPPREAGFRGGPACVVWRTRAAHGPALVRFDALPVTERGCAYRHPSPCLHPPGRLPCDTHLWADADGPEALRVHADVLVSRVPRAVTEARRRVRVLLAEHPGCLAAVVPGFGAGCVVGVRRAAGDPWCARLERGGPRAPASPQAVASVLHAWVAAGGAPGALRAVVPAFPG